MNNAELWSYCGNGVVRVNVWMCTGTIRSGIWAFVNKYEIEMVCQSLC